MKNVIIFSSMYPTKKVCVRVNKLLKNRRIGYIPAGLYDRPGIHDGWSYAKMGFESAVSCPLGKYYDERRVDAVFKCDAIHLGGGNTFEFLYLLRFRNLLDRLREFVANGGILMGTSAGGIMMCQQIRIAGFADDNYMGLIDLDALGLVDFEVKPHWDAWKSIEKTFRQYARKAGVTLFGLSEGQSIWVTDNGIKFYGNMPLKIKGGGK